VRDYQVCDVITKNYDDEFKRSCGPKSIRSPEKAIEAAIESFNYYKKTGRFFFFDRLECNCEHWVVSWKYGVAWSLQLNTVGAALYYGLLKGNHGRKEKSHRCEAPGAMKCAS